MKAAPKRKLTPQEYLAVERAAEFKSEFYEGEMYPLGGGPEATAGGSRRHSRISTNLIYTLQKHLEGRPCQVINSDLRVHVAAHGLYTYPDLSALCGEPEFDGPDEDTLLNPQVIIEVLSPSTEAYDRGEKFRRYEALASLSEYVIVAQDRPSILRYTREVDGSWRLVFIHGLEATLALVSLQAELPLAEIYAKVDFTPAAESATTPPA